MLSVGLSGHFRLEVRDACTHKLTKVREFDNLITNRGLDGYGYGDDRYLLNNCYVGTGMALPAVTDVGLGVPLASTSGVAETKHIAPTAPDWVSARVNRYRFSVGSVIGNISEVGIGGEKYFWSRARILDDYGNPSDITVLANEYLDVIYTLRLHPNLNDIPFSFTLGGETYTGTARPQNIQDSAITGDATLSVYGGISPNSGIEINEVYNGGVLGTITQGIQNYSSKLTVGPSAWAKQDYVPGSYVRKFDNTLSLDEGNFTEGIKAFSVIPRPVGNYGIIGSQFRFESQIVLNKAIPKNNTNSVRLTLQVRWGRYSGS